MRQHKKDYYNKNILIFNAIRKYSWENIEKEIICAIPIEFADIAERYFIKEYNSIDNEFGYNLESGGHKNKKHSDITKRKISIANGGKDNPMYGKNHSIESIEIIREKTK